MIIWSEGVDKNFHQLSEGPSCNSSCNPINAIKTLYVRLMDLKEQIFLDFETVDIDISLDCLHLGEILW